MIVVKELLDDYYTEFTPVDATEANGEEIKVMIKK
jgi:hypothetical protein